MRAKPYTECGKPSVHQWQICSLGNKFAGVCRECDIELNKIVLKFMKIKNWLRIIKKYKVSNAQG